LWINGNPNPNSGGTETHSIHFVKELLKEKDIDLYLALAENSFVDKNLKFFPENKKIYIKIKGEFSPLSTIKLINFAKKIKPDYIIGNNGNEYINTFIAAKFSNSKPVVFRHMTNKQPFFLRKFVLPKMYKIFAVSDYVKEGLLKQGIKENVEVLPNFLEKDFIFNKEKREKIRKKLNIDSKQVILFVGKFGKGINDFLEVIKYFKNDSSKYFIIIGYGKEEEQVKEFIKKDSLEDKVLFLGQVKNPYEYYLASDIFIMPSKADESFGRTVIEAMATKTVVVAYPSGNVKYLIKNKNTGFLTSEKNPQEIIDIINKLDKETQRKIKENAFNFYNENFNRDTVINKFKSFLI
jgi:glycosyltransferase involved in cell wall biosynthesis